LGVRSHVGAKQHGRDSSFSFGEPANGTIARCYRSVFGASHVRQQTAEAAPAKADPAPGRSGFSRDAHDAAQSELRVLIHPADCRCATSEPAGWIKPRKRRNALPDMQQSWRQMMNESDAEIWLLRAGAETKYMRLAGHLPNDDYWERYFCGRFMPADWQLPPLEILGKSKKLGDYVGWMLQAPIVSDRARNVLEPTVGTDVQFVPFHDLRGEPFFGMNVLRVEQGFLDTNRSVCVRRRNGDIAYCSQYFFRSDLPAELPPIFKISGGSNVFVTARAVTKIVEHQLTGFCLQNPNENAFALMGKGIPLNVYSDLP
jgi:hypothetical protein